MFKGIGIAVATTDQIIHHDRPAGTLGNHIPGTGKMVIRQRQTLFKHIPIGPKVIDHGLGAGTQSMAGQIVGQHRVTQLQ